MEISLSFVGLFTTTIILLRRSGIPRAGVLHSICEMHEVEVFANTFLTGMTIQLEQTVRKVILLPSIGPTKHLGGFARVGSRYLPLSFQNHKFELKSVSSWYGHLRLFSSRGVQRLRFQVFPKRWHLSAFQQVDITIKRQRTEEKIFTDWRKHVKELRCC